MRLLIVTLVGSIFSQVPATAHDFKGPGRYCGYSPVIDLLEDEAILPLDGGMHAGRFRWTGGFGELEVFGVGWASKPPGVKLPRKNSKGQTVFAERRTDGRFSIAIWNRREGAAYFFSDKPMTRAQRDAIDRVDLYQEGEQPNGCELQPTSAVDSP